MRGLLARVAERWRSYRYRFTPWIALNLGREAVVVEASLPSTEVLVGRLEEVLEALVQYSSLRDDLELYADLHHRNQVRLLVLGLGESDELSRRNS